MQKNFFASLSLTLWISSASLCNLLSMSVLREMRIQTKICCRSYEVAYQQFVWLSNHTSQSPFIKKISQRWKHMQGSKRKFSGDWVISTINSIKYCLSNVKLNINKPSMYGSLSRSTLNWENWSSFPTFSRNFVILTKTEERRMEINSP